MCKKIYSSDSNVIIWFIYSPLLPLPSTFPYQAKYFTSSNETRNMCVCADLTSLAYIYIVYNYRMEYISWCLNRDYSLITQLHYFCTYMHALNFSSIWVDCTNILPSIYIYLEFNFLHSDWLKIITSYANQPTLETSDGWSNICNSLIVILKLIEILYHYRDTL